MIFAYYGFFFFTIAILDGSGHDSTLQLPYKTVLDATRTDCSFPLPCNTTLYHNAASHCVTIPYGAEPNNSVAPQDPTNQHLTIAAQYDTILHIAIA